MQRSIKKTPLATWMDRALIRLAALAAGIAWFVFLWGVSLPAVSAGLAYGALLLVCVERFQRLTTRRRERQLRRRIGGELALDALLTEEPERASFRAATWLASATGLKLLKAVEAGVLVTLEDRTLLVRTLALHPSKAADVQRMIEARRAALRCEVDGCILCLTCGVEREAEAYAEVGQPTLRIVRRDELIRYAGACVPATDEQLRELGRRKRVRAGRKRWMAHILQPKRAGRYFLYGLGLAALYLLTRLPYYPIPAALCLCMSALCKVYKPKEKRSFFP